MTAEALDTQAPRFAIFDEYEFEEFLRVSGFFVRKQEDWTAEGSTVTPFKANLHEVVKRFRSRRMFNPAQTAPFYADAQFVWVLDIDNYAPEGKIGAASLIRFANDGDNKGEIVYIDTDYNDDIPTLVELHEVGSKVCRTWDSGVFPLNLAQWKNELTANFLKFIERPLLRDDVFA